jgi:hypothetical protein
LITAVHPVASTGPIFLAIIAAGKFHGTSSAQTPTGCLTVKFLVPGRLQGMVVPFERSASPANQLRKLAA